MLMSHLLLDYLVLYLLFIFIFYVSCSILITYLKQHVNWIFCFLSQIFFINPNLYFFLNTKKKKNEKLKSLLRYLALCYAGLYLT